MKSNYRRFEVHRDYEDIAIGISIGKSVYAEPYKRYLSIDFLIWSFILRF